MNVIIKALLDALELDLHILAQLQVQRAQRLVQQKHLRMVHKRPRDGHALLLPAGERGRVAPLVALQAHQLQHLQAAGADLFFVQLLQPQMKRPFSNTFRCGNSAYFWNTVLTCRLYGGRRVMSLPAKKHCPISAPRTLR